MNVHRAAAVCVQHSGERQHLVLGDAEATREKACSELLCVEVAAAVLVSLDKGRAQRLFLALQPPSHIVHPINGGVHRVRALAGPVGTSVGCARMCTSATSWSARPPLQLC
jgi:hypothetical protein